jgi:GAF domain-containing protein/HAMP domain-containing protein
MIQDAFEGKIRSEEPVRGYFSLRTRLIAANTLIVALAIAAMGIFVYLRAQESTGALSAQLAETVTQQAKDDLAANSQQQVASLNGFFTALRTQILDASSTAGSLLSNQPALAGGLYWDAKTSMSRRANGSWDNASGTDPAAVFIPAKADLTDELAAELDTLKQLDFVIPAKLRSNPDVVAIYFGGLTGETLYYPDVDLYSLVPPDFDVTQREWFLNASPAKNPTRQAVWSTPYSDAARHGLVVTTSAPVYDTSGTFRGVLAMDIQLGRITASVANIHAAETGYAFLVDRDKRLIAMPPAGYADLGTTSEVLPLGEIVDPAKPGSGLPASFGDLLTKLSSGQTGMETISVGGSDRVVAYRPIPDVGYGMAIMVPAGELMAGATAAEAQMTASSTNTTQLSLVLVAVIVFFAVLANVLLGNSLTRPLLTLTQTAQEIIGGNLNAHSKISSRDEIGVLSQTLDVMTENVREMVRSLEQRVRDRTAQLEVATSDASRRADEFEAITRVTKAIGSTRDMDELMPLVASVISEFFGYYHVGIFLNDEASGQANLIAANSEGGRKMLARHHSLRIGEQGIVGYVAARGESRVARNVGEDIVFFNNPDLPRTKSEAALPLRTADRILGVLDMQSTMEDAFTPDDLRILATLADQVVLSIENARLFETTRRSLMETETLYRQYLQDAWRRVDPDEQVAGYRYSPRGSAPLRQGSPPGTADGFGALGRAGQAEPITVPIKLRGQAIGDLVVQRPAAGEWTQDQIDLVQAVADRVALSVENARLFDVTSRRAERERLVAEIAAKIRSTNDPQAMMDTALRELRQALGSAQVDILPQSVIGSRADESAVPAAPRAAGGESVPGNGAKP